MTATPNHPTNNSTRRHGHLALAAAVALGFLSISCGDDHDVTNQIPATTTTGYSYNHDSHHD